ncbi:retrotransposon-derived protein PEG10-like, partial [Trifolium medium]|nr:retrotransposon-derived protein PEG10-like [Trifolium medium]
MQLRRSKGLCFNCDERFHTGHRCKHRQFLLLLGDEDSDTHEDPLYALLAPNVPDPTQTPIPSTLLTPNQEPNPHPPPPSPPDSELFQLSLQAATGQPSPRTLRFTATIHNRRVTVLVDSGSSHNIIQPRITSFLHLPVQPLSSFTVMVGNGEHLHCTGICNDIPIVVNDHTFSISLYVLPIQGADVVLGVQWLQTLGPFVSDFTIPSMQFYPHDSLLTIT